MHLAKCRIFIRHPGQVKMSCALEQDTNIFCCFFLFFSPGLEGIWWSAKYSSSRSAKIFCVVLFLSPDLEDSWWSAENIHHPGKAKTFSTVLLESLSPDLEGLLVEHTEYSLSRARPCPLRCQVEDTASSYPTSAAWYPVELLWRSCSKPKLRHWAAPTPAWSENKCITFTLSSLLRCSWAGTQGCTTVVL